MWYFISLFHHDVAFQQQPFQNQLHAERFIAEITHAERDVLKVTENRHVLRGVIVAHVRRFQEDEGGCGRRSEVRRCSEV